MELYLVQHGEARPEEEDPDRPLTERGRDEVERIALAAARAGLRPERILHSGKLRARQTADILFLALRPEQGVHESPSLGPNDDPAKASHAVEDAAGSLMVVGHLPHLSRLCSLLLLGDPDRELVAFRMGGIVCLTMDQGRWRLRWMLTPELVAG